jgi:two-component system response regulator DegU
VDKLKVMVVDGQTFFRAGLQQALSAQPDFQVTECDPYQDPLSTIENNLIDVVLLGAELVNQDGPDLCRKITRLYPNTRVIVMSPNPDDSELFEVMKMAAAAYLGKNSSTADITDTIRRATHGEYPINESLTRPKVAGNVLKQFQASIIPGAVDPVTASLTNRETEILKYIATGNSNKQIAGLLEISEQTIKNHISSILRKLNANDRAHAVVLAIKHGWISVEENAAKAAGR